MRINSNKIINFILRHKIRSLLFAIILNLILVFEIKMSIRSIEENQFDYTELKNSKEEKVYDSYYIINFEINRGFCQPTSMFNSTRSIQSIEKMTNEIIRLRISENITILLNILRINVILDKLDQIEQIKKKILVCDYTVELFVGIRYPLFCNQICQSNENIYILTDDDYSQFQFDLFDHNSMQISAQYFIENLILYQAYRYFGQRVCIKSKSNDSYISIPDTNYLEDNLIMSNTRRTQFVLEKSLDFLNKSLITVSFLSLYASNIYLRHERNLLKLSKNDYSILFQQDSTFELKFNYQKDLLAIQPINLPGNFFVTIHSNNLILKKYSKSIQIEQLPFNSIFQFVSC